MMCLTHYHYQDAWCRCSLETMPLARVTRTSRLDLHDFLDPVSKFLGRPPPKPWLYYESNHISACEYVVRGLCICRKMYVLLHRDRYTRINSLFEDVVHVSIVSLSTRDLLIGEAREWDMQWKVVKNPCGMLRLSSDLGPRGEPCFDNIASNKQGWQSSGNAKARYRIPPRCRPVLRSGLGLVIVDTPSCPYACVYYSASC